MFYIANSRSVSVWIIAKPLGLHSTRRSSQHQSVSAVTAESAVAGSASRFVDKDMRHQHNDINSNNINKLVTVTVTNVPINT